MPTKYFLPGRPGFEGCGFLVMLKRANRLAPAIRKRKLATAPSCSNFVRISPRSCGNCRNPHIQASMAGATPKVITSASESNSRPKSLLVCVMRAMRPSRPSNSTANPIALAAKSRSEEHTSELQSHSDLVCRLLLEKKKKNIQITEKSKKTENTEHTQIQYVLVHG